MADIERNFKYHAPTDAKVAFHEAVRAEAKNLAMFILNNCPPGRETSIAITKIEEAMMWANAAIARGD